MATIGQIQRSIESCNKDIEKTQKSIDRLNGQINKRLDKLSKDSGEVATLDNYHELSTKTYGKESKAWWHMENISMYVYDLDYATRHQNVTKKRLESLQSELASLTSAQEEAESGRKDTLEALTKATESQRGVWLERCFDIYSMRHDNLLEHKQEYKDKYDELRQEYDTLRVKYGWRGSYELDECERSMNHYGKILADQAYKMGKDEYVNLMVTECGKLWDNNLIKLADDCKKYNLDLTKLEVSVDTPTPKGFELTIMDGKPRVVYARIIFCAEDSEYVSPHMRYIITSKKLK